EGVRQAAKPAQMQGRRGGKRLSSDPSREPNLDGKEGVDGSSPSEGFSGEEIPGNRGFLLPGAALETSARCGERARCNLGTGFGARPQPVGFTALDSPMAILDALSVTTALRAVRVV